MRDRQPQPWWAKPKPVIQTSGTGFNTEARIVAPSDDSEQTALPHSPMSDAHSLMPGRQHGGVPPSPRR
jgi:hypothetical protein